MKKKLIYYTKLLEKGLLSKTYLDTFKYNMHIKKLKNELEEVKNKFEEVKKRLENDKEI